MASPNSDHENEASKSTSSENHNPARPAPPPAQNDVESRPTPSDTGGSNTDNGDRLADYAHIFKIGLDVMKDLRQENDQALEGRVNAEESLEKIQRIASEYPSKNNNKITRSVLQSLKENRAERNAESLQSTLEDYKTIITGQDAELKAVKAELEAYKKRGAEAMELQQPLPPPKKAKKSFVVCIPCYNRTLDKTCDACTPCQNCIKLGKNCRRGRCKQFVKGACTKINCRLAHEEDGYPVTVHIAHVQRIAPGQLEPRTKKNRNIKKEMKRKEKGRKEAEANAGVIETNAGVIEPNAEGSVA